MGANADIYGRREAAIASGILHSTSITAQRALNAEVWDVEGRRFIDFAGGIAVLNTGHAHPRVIAAAREQMERFTHTCFQVALYEPYVELAERLNAICPLEGPAKTALFSTGAEATENAVKIARAATGRSGVVSFTGSFHGRTLLSLSMTGKVSPYRAGFGSMVPEVFHAPFPCAALASAWRTPNVISIFCSVRRSTPRASPRSSSNQFRVKADFIKRLPS